ncbi:MAG: hypothetical protein MJ124_04035 [Lachnospiraceae bacterium]|nr:hypothetical protein [Lachnospiraceae bacterium]
MGMFLGNYEISFENGGVNIFEGKKEAERLKYRNKAPLSVFVKTRMAITECYENIYETVEQCGNQVRTKGSVETPYGSCFEFEDVYEIIGRDLKINRNVEVLKAGSELGFATRISFFTVDSDKAEDYFCFAPGVWYRNNENAPDAVIGKDLSCESFWNMETKMALPLFAMQSKADGRTISLSRWAADMTLRNTNLKRSENYVDEKITTGAIGMSRLTERTMNYLYYGYGVRTVAGNNQTGLAIDYLYPGADGQTPYVNTYSGLDFHEKPMKLMRINHPVKQGFVQNYSVGLQLGEYDDFNEMMRETWRNVYSRIRDDYFQVDNKAFYEEGMKAFDECTQLYGEAYGLPFACQLPNLDISSISYQFGFVGQQPGIGYLLLQKGINEQNGALAEKGEKVIDFWVKRGICENGMPKMCFNPAENDFEPYPFYIRMMADGLEAILEAWTFMKNKGVQKPEWLEFCRKAAEWIVGIQNEDGSFAHAYFEDGSVRMDDKGISTCIIRFLVRMSVAMKDKRYELAALRAGEYSYTNLYKKTAYRGGTCDNATITDKESGIYALFGFHALYDLTKDAKWLEAAKGAGDYTETWTYAWKYPIITQFKQHPFNKFSISGQSMITIMGGADIYMAACAYEFYRLYLSSGDEHYLDFAKFAYKNTRQINDVDGSAGYIYRAISNEACRFDEQTLLCQYHWLPWCTFVEVQPTAELLDNFSVYEIEDAEKLPMEERLKRNGYLEKYI